MHDQCSADCLGFMTINDQIQIVNGCVNKYNLISASLFLYKCDLRSTVSVCAR